MPIIDAMQKIKVGFVLGSDWVRTLDAFVQWEMVMARSWKCSSSPLSGVLLSTVSFSCGQTQSENIKWKIPAITSQVLNCAPLWVSWWNLALPCSVLPGHKSSLFVHCTHAVYTLPVSHLVAISADPSIVMVSQCTSSDAGNSGMPKRIHEVLPISEKVCLYRRKHYMYSLVLSTVSGIY